MGDGRLFGFLTSFSYTFSLMCFPEKNRLTRATKNTWYAFVPGVFGRDILIAFVHKTKKKSHHHLCSKIVIWYTIFARAYFNSLLFFLRFFYFNLLRLPENIINYLFWIENFNVFAKILHKKLICFYFSLFFKVLIM